MTCRDKVAIVTGAAGKGMGRSIALTLAREGARGAVNYRTSAAGFVRVEIQDAASKPFPGHTLADCPEIIGDAVEHIVTWQHRADVSRLAGRPVRLHFVLKDADLFALRFQ